jgi:putative transposase
MQTLELRVKSQELGVKGQEERNIDGRDGKTTAPASEKGMAQALAAYDLLQVWRQFRQGFEGTKAEADPSFIKLYSAGIMYEHIRQAVKDVSIKTLYRWDKEVGESNDWRRLIAGYHMGKDSYERLTDEEIKIFKYWLLHENRLSIAQAIKQTKLMLMALGYKDLKSDMTFRRWAQEFERQNKALWVTKRQGEKARKDMLDPYIERDASRLTVGDCFVLDGHKLNVMLKSPATGKPVRATLIGVLDWRSWDLMGYEVMLTENMMCIASAFRQAVLYLGHTPSVVYIDNGKAFKARFFTKTADISGMQGLYQRLGVEVVAAKPYNARAKVIEPWFNILNAQFERLLPTYSGASIADKPARYLRNEKLSAWIHKTLHGDYTPDLYEFIEMMEQWLYFYRHTNECPNNKGYTIAQTVGQYKQTEAYKAKAKPQPDVLDDLMLAQKEVMIYQNGVRMHGEFYWHEAFYGLKGERTTVRYSIFDRSWVLAAHPFKNERLVAKTREKSHPMARVLGNEADVKQLAEQIEENSRPARQVKADIKALIPELKETKAFIDNTIAEYARQVLIVDRQASSVERGASREAIGWGKPAEEAQEAGSADLSVLIPDAIEASAEQKKKIILFESEG